MNTANKITANQSRIYLAVLLLFAAVFLFTATGDVQLVDWDENIYAEASRQMIARGNYLNVYINEHLFAEKPPFYFWEQVLSYKIFGINEFAARFPSGVAGMLMLLLFFQIGKKIGAPKMGLIWGLVYLTSFLPSVFGRVAVIDHTFNLFIASAAYFLYLFDTSYRIYQSSASNSPDQSVQRFSYLAYLTSASICMGVATLTKGPLGGVIPLVSFAGYKLFYRQPKVRIAHFVYCAVLSLSLALSWYVINWIKTGESFLTGFIRFQLLLFSKSLEGHEGPFFYHFAVALVGLLPWTALLFSRRPKLAVSINRHFAPLYILGITWIGFVLILFSLVSTKLPHYSASIYIPLSMIVAFNLFHSLETGWKLPSWSIVLFTLLGVGLAGLFISIPTLLKEYAAIQMVSMPQVPTHPIMILGAILAVCFLLGGIYFYQNKLKTGLVLTVLAMLVFTQGLWRLQLPIFIDIHQKPLLQVLEEANAKNGQVVFYRMVSFAAFFYGGKQIEVLYNYKFPGDPTVLNKRHDLDLYIISDIENAKRLQEDYPLVQKQNQVGRICLFTIEKMPQ